MTAQKSFRATKLFTVVSAMVALVFMLTGCESLPSGTIYQKKYVPRTETTTMICSSYSSSGACNLWIPQYNEYPECYKIYYRDNDKKDSTCVDKESFDSHSIGDHFTL